MEVPSPLTGVVVEVIADDGATVAAGASVLLLEAMKMHQEVAAPASGIVRELAVAVGDQVQEGQPLFQLEEREIETPPAEEGPAAADRGAERTDLAEAIERRRLTSDEARPGAVERRRMGRGRIRR